MNTTIPTQTRNVDTNMRARRTDATNAQLTDHREEPMRDIAFGLGATPLGLALVAGSEHGLRAILLGDDAQALQRELGELFPLARLVRADAVLAASIAEVAAYIERPHGALDLPLDIRGTPFQRRVWQTLREIPSGTTASYVDIARGIGAPRAFRAVAAACAANPLALAIPCHRVVKRDGGLSGYRWGVERKRALLEREAAAA